MEHWLGTAIFLANVITWTYFVSWYWSDAAIQRRLGHDKE